MIMSKLKSSKALFKEVLKLSLCFSIDFFLKPAEKIIPKSLLLIRLDAIGDYILFRNFIEILKKSDKYKDYSITLVGNVAWKELSEVLDREYVSKYIWIDRRKFIRNPAYRYNKLKEIVSTGYELVLSPVYSREFFYADSIVKLVNAKEKVGSVGDLSNIKKWEKSWSDKWYSRLIPATDKVIFEFYRNKEFFEAFLETKLDIQKPFIKLKQSKPPLELPKKFALLFIGAQHNFKKWSIHNYVVVADFLRKRYDYEIVLCGGKGDINDALRFREKFKGDYIDLVGKVNLIELLYVVNKSELIISNDTMLPHIAAALDKDNIFVIYKGDHFGRFVPYPKEISDGYHTIFHPVIEKELNNYEKLTNSYGYGSNLNINDITTEMVLEKIERVLK